jgi:hypothetical protein
MMPLAQIPETGLGTERFIECAVEILVARDGERSQIAGAGWLGEDLDHGRRLLAGEVRA